MSNSPKAYDVAFAHAIRKCAVTLTPKRKKGEPYVDGDELAALLRSDMPLNQGERELLAELVTGELQRPHKRPSVSITSDKIAPVLDRYFERLDVCKKHKVAFIDAKEFYKEIHGRNVSESQLHSWIAECKKREPKRKSKTTPK